MRRLIHSLILGALVATPALPALAFAPAPDTAAVVQDDAQAKADLYKRFTDNYKTNTPVAYDAAKEYVTKYPNDDPTIINYLKKWMSKYEAASAKSQRQVQFAQLMTDRKYAEAMALGKQILADQPDDLNTLYNMASAGISLVSTGNVAVAPDATMYAKKSLDLIQAGKTFEEGKPLDPKAKSETIGFLNYGLGVIALKSNPPDPTGAVQYLIAAAQNEGQIKNDPQTYYLLAIAYQAAYYVPMQKDFAKYEGQPETPESKAALDNLYQVADRIIDAYARAVSLAGTNAKYAAKKTEWMGQLSDFYKFRHKSDTGLNELIAGIKNTPLPTGAITMTAAPTPSPSPSGSGGATGTSASTATPATPAATTTPTTTATPVKPKGATPGRPRR